MESIFDTVYILLWLTLVTLSLCFVFGLKRRQSLVGKFYLLLTSLSMWWVIGDILMLSSGGDESWFDFFRDFRRPAPIWMVMFTFWMVCAFLGLNFWLRKRVMLACSMAIMVGHVLFWSPLSDWMLCDHKTVQFGGYLLKDVGRGPYLIALQLYLYVILFFTLAVLLKESRGKDRNIRYQSLCLFASMLIPIVVNYIWVTNATPGFYDPTPLALILTGPLQLYAIWRFRFLDLLPTVYHSLFEHLQSPALALDSKGNLIAYNQSASEAFPKHALILSEKIDKLWSYLGTKTSLDIKNNQVFEVSIKDESVKKFFSVEVTPVFDQRNVCIGSSVLFHDITAMVENKRQAEVARLVAEKANRAKSMFIADMSHEIRTPLNSVIGFATLLEMKASDKDREILSAIRSNGEVLLRLINDILDLSKLETGNLRTQSEPVNLPELLSLLCRPFRERCRQKSLKFELNIPEDLPVFFRVDGVRIKQILGNLLDNAVKYTGKGSIVLSVEWIARDRGNKDEIVFQVQDTGAGIPEQHLERVFEAFYRDQEMSFQTSGTGIGLTLSRRLAEQMNGKLQAHPSNTGALFSFRVPAEKEKGFSSRNELRKSHKTFENARVLVVDDVRDNRLILSELLSSFGLNSFEATSGTEGLEMLKEREYDLIFLDLKMPEMNGLSFLKAYHAQGRKAPVVVVTASVREDDENDALSAGADAFIRKPIRINQLEVLLTRFFQVRDDRGEKEDFPVFCENLPMETWLEHREEWEKLHRSFILDRAKSFADEIEQTIRKTKNEGLINWKKEFSDRLENYDFEEAKRLLSGFPHLFDRKEGKEKANERN